MRSFAYLTLPAAAAGRDAFACAVKTGALEQAQKLLEGRHADRVADALDFPASGCDDNHLPADAGSAQPRSAKPAEGVVLHISASGDDAALGGSETPLRTLHEAQRRLREMRPETRAGAHVQLSDGTHFLDETLVFTEADSGTAEKPVTWSAGAAVVSGGRKLDCQGKWQAGSGGVYECDLGAAASFDSLFVGGARQVRARFPNGSPLLPKDGYVAGCKTTATTMPGKALPKNMEVLAADGKTVISQLSAKPLNESLSVTVKDTSKARTVNDCKTNQDQYQGTRFNETFNYPFWLTAAPTDIELPSEFQDRTWQAPKGAVVKMLHPAGWGGWAFEVESVDGSAMKFSKGGFQEARGNSGCGEMYVENLGEELDSPGEWFLDSEQGKLFFMPPANMTEAELQEAEVVAPALPRLLQFRGESGRPVHDIVLEGFNVSHAAPTYLESYEAPSGGDWSIHRGGAIFLDGAERISMRRLVFDQVDGNAVFLSNHAVDNVVEQCDFWRTGDSAVAVLGSVPLGDAREGSGAAWPKGNRISENWIEEVGVHMKQTSCVFRSLAEQTTIRNNVCYNGPRAGLNYNDAFKGGDVVEGNVIFNMVRETGDHGTFNSWDRREYVFDCDDAGACFTPSTIHVRHNMFIGPAGWNMDHDDGSSQYEDFSNVVYLGGYKYRDGVMRNMTGNLMIQAAPAFQVTGFDTNYWVDNTVVDTQVTDICAPDTTAALTGTTYAVLDAPSPPAPSPYPGWDVTYCQSCENNELLKDMGENYGSLVDCMSACGYQEGCAFINYAESSDHHCVLYKDCSPPKTQSGCDTSKHEWWSTWAKTSDQASSLRVTDDCWTTGNCICDTGKQIKINETDLIDLIRSTVKVAQQETEVPATVLI